MMSSHHGSSSDATPICRCRVLYLGSAVPHITKDGLQGIQEPLRELYPEMGALSARGIDSWLSVWSNGILLENVDENHKKVTRFFPIDTLHYCAAVRYVLVPEKSSSSAPGSASQPRFLPLDSPFARSPNPNHPPLFACILRRTTGIKVLECHTFICKREMAANALVRCCFHAYADSSYARSIDNPGYGTVGGPGSGAPSTYGTLTKDCTIGSSASSIDKVDGWRKMMSSEGRAGGMGGSTLTLDSAVVHNSSASPTYNNTTSAGGGSQSLVITDDFSRSQDDISMYNGDENHKIWAGSAREASDGEEGIYGEYSSSTMKSQRSSRPRQIVSAAPPPPPPPNDEKKQSNDIGRRKKKSGGESIGGGSREEVYPPGMNGSLLRPGNHHYHNTVRSHGSGAGMPPMMRYAPNSGHPQPLLVPVPPSTIPHLRRAGGKGSNGGGRLPPQIIPAPPFHHLPPPQPMPTMYVPTGKKGKPYPLSMEEPIYMPSNRPMSPVSSYQPCHFPIEAYLMHHYATMTPTSKKKKNKKGSNSGTLMIPPPLIPVMPPPPPPHMTLEEWGDASLYGVHPVHRNGGSAKGAGRHPPPPSGHHHYPPPPPGHRTNGGHHMEGPDLRDVGNGNEEGDEDGGGEDSPYNTGIYRRKGHINERAFSYSIRQEHRSRSYGSLANLKFAPLPVVPSSYYEGGPVEGNGTGGGVNRKEEIKKEREIMQMMQDLDLSGDDIERSEVPANMYQHAQRGGGAGTGPRGGSSRPVDPRRS